MARSEPRVLILLDSLAPGGAEQSTVALLGPLLDRGVAVELATLRRRPGADDPLRAQVADAAVTLHDLSGPGGRVGAVRRTGHLIGRLRPDLVHTSLFEADVAGRLAAASRRVRSVTTLPTERYGSAHVRAPHLNPAKVRATQALDVATARLATRLHAVSHHVADTMAHHLRYRRSRIDVVHRGRPLPPPPPPPGERAELRRSLGVGDDERVVLMVARHTHAKGIDRMVAAMGHLAVSDVPTTLIVAGQEGGHTEALRQQVASAGLADAVRFLGHRTDVSALHAVADVFALPSRREGLPGSLLEAMAAGTPAVINDLPQITEVAGRDEAVVVDADDHRALADGVAGLLGDPDRRSQLATAARARFVERFTLDRSADGMVEFYRRALA